MALSRGLEGLHPGFLTHHHVNYPQDLLSVSSSELDLSPPLPETPMT